MPRKRKEALESIGGRGFEAPTSTILQSFIFEGVKWIRRLAIEQRTSRGTIAPRKSEMETINVTAPKARAFAAAA